MSNYLNLNSTRLGGVGLGWVGYWGRRKGAVAWRSMWQQAQIGNVAQGTEVPISACCHPSSPPNVSALLLFSHCRPQLIHVHKQLDGTHHVESMG